MSDYLVGGGGFTVVSTPMLFSGFGGFGVLTTRQLAYFRLPIAQLCRGAVLCK